MFPKSAAPKPTTVYSSAYIMLEVNGQTFQHLERSVTGVSQLRPAGKDRLRNAQDPLLIDACKTSQQGSNQLEHKYIQKQQYLASSSHYLIEMNEWSLAYRNSTHLHAVEQRPRQTQHGKWHTTMCPACHVEFGQSFVHQHGNDY